MYDASSAGGRKYVMMSTYAYTNLNAILRENRWTHVLRSLEELDVVGRIYVSQQGANAQIAVPKSRMSEFPSDSARPSQPLESRLVRDVELSPEEFREYPPFKNKLQVKNRELVSLGGDEEDLSSLVLRIVVMKSHRKIGIGICPPNPVVLDVRNKYESEVGAFENAVPLNTTQFKETWSALRDILKDKPKNEPVYMYCTGGYSVCCGWIVLEAETRIRKYQTTRGWYRGILATSIERIRDLEVSTTSSTDDTESSWEMTYRSFRIPHYLRDERRGVEALQVLDERSSRREPRSTSDCDLAVSSLRKVVNARESYAEKHDTGILGTSKSKRDDRQSFSSRLAHGERSASRSISYHAEFVMQSQPECSNSEPLLRTARSVLPRRNL